MKYSYLLILFLLTTLAVHSQNAKDTLNAEYINNEKIGAKTDLIPEYPGGLKKMHYFIRDNLKYPINAQLEGIVGRVVIQVIVSKTGNVIKYSINKSVHPLLDQEALRVVKKMPKKGWAPGQVNGESVDMRYTIPITFQLELKVQGDEDISHKEQSSLPSYPGGETAMQAFIRQNLEYPAEAQKKEIEGRVYLQFIVTEIGEISDIEVSRSVHPLLDNEAIRVVKMMPKWIPATENGEPIKAVFELPMQFRLF
ncbi:MAG: TonB family protein [Dysgonomonas sp.]